MRSNTTFLKLVVLLALIGAGVSVKLLMMHNSFSSGTAALTAGCAIGGSSCETVTLSKYSEVFGVPLASITLGYYLTIILLCGWSLANQQSANEPLYVSAFLSTLAVVVTVVMFCIAKFALNAFCQYCAMLWLVNLSIWPCLVKQLGLGFAKPLAATSCLFGAGPVKLRRERVIGSFVTGLVCVAAFITLGLVTRAGAEVPGEGAAKLIQDYNNAPITMLSAEAYGGPTSKGFHGESGAPVIDIVELADFQCPGCKMAGQMLKPFVLKHGDQVRVTFRNFPLDGSCNPYAPGGRHPVACAIARGSLCAAKQNKFWEFHDEIYDRQSEDTSLQTIKDVVKAVGIDEAAFDACVKDQATEMALQKDMQLGDLVKLESTPTLIVNNHKLVGARTPAEFEALLHELEKK